MASTPSGRRSCSTSFRTGQNESCAPASSVRATLVALNARTARARLRLQAIASESAPTSNVFRRASAPTRSVEQRLSSLRHQHERRSTSKGASPLDARLSRPKPSSTTAPVRRTCSCRLRAEQKRSQRVSRAPYSLTSAEAVWEHAYVVIDGLMPTARAAWVMQRGFVDREPNSCTAEP